jgi:hypothetical protein
VSIVVGSCAVWTLGACAGATAATQPPTSISVREVNIVDERGQTRVRLGAPLPDPKGLKRALTIYGIQFMDAEGREVGGLAMLDAAGINGLCFDTVDGYSLMCMGLIKGQPSVTLSDRSGERISLGVNNGVASVVVNDGNRNARLRLEVDKEGQARVEGLNSPQGGK